LPPAASPLAAAPPPAGGGTGCPDHWTGGCGPADLPGSLAPPLPPARPPDALADCCAFDVRDTSRPGGRGCRRPEPRNWAAAEEASEPDADGGLDADAGLAGAAFADEDGDADASAPRAAPPTAGLNSK